MHGLKINEGHTRLLEDAEMSLYQQTTNVIHFIGNVFVGVCVWGDELPLRWNMKGQKLTEIIIEGLNGVEW